MGNLKFEWDQQKNSVNKQKHRVSFEEAETVFHDEHALLMGDPAHSENEDRFTLLGLSANLRAVVVCHCYRGSDIIRIISARKATERERAVYNRRRFK